MRLASGELVAHWLQKSGVDTYAYDVRLSYSKDDGKTWSASFTPHSDGTKTEHGFASLFQMPGAGLGLAWLDGRAMKPGGSHDAIRSPCSGTSRRPKDASGDESGNPWLVCSCRWPQWSAFPSSLSLATESCVDR